MATNYLYGTVLTAEAVAANNRGDNIGNTTTLQKVFHQDDLHTSVSAESIRFALRYRFQLENLKVNKGPQPGAPQATDLAFTDAIYPGQFATLSGRLVDPGQGPGLVHLHEIRRGGDQGRGRGRHQDRRRCISS